MSFAEPVEFELLGCHIVHDPMGHLAISHDGTMTWDKLQLIKNKVWGEEAVAIEVYPPTSRLVNVRNCRHLWLLGAGDFYPDLLGLQEPVDTLEARYHARWAEARNV